MNHWKDLQTGGQSADPRPADCQKSLGTIVPSTTWYLRTATVAWVGGADDRKTVIHTIHLCCNWMIRCSSYFPSVDITPNGLPFSPPQTGANERRTQSEFGHKTDPTGLPRGVSHV